MTRTCAVALKEWKIVVDRLAAGHQALLLRKGGIVEPRGDFALERREFFLFPTWLHQNAEALRPDVAADWANAESPASPPGAPQSKAEPSEIELSAHAEVAGAWRVADLDPLRALEPFQSLNWDAIERRFNYRGQPGLHALLLRVRPLASPIRVANTPAYQGCRSWVDLESPLAADLAAPALDDAAFDSLAAQLRRALAGCEAE